MESQPRTSETANASFEPRSGGGLLAGLQQYHLWGRLGWLEVKRRYRRTIIGPFWSALSLAIFVAALGIVGANLWRQSMSEFLPFLTAGLVAWAFISASLTEACTVFVNYTSIMHQLSFNYSILIYALVWRGLVVFVHNLIVYVVVMLFFDVDRIGWTVFLALPGLLIVAVNLAWLALFVGIACLRYRDLQQIVTSLVQLSIFVTPIFWLPSHLTGAARIAFVVMNPLWHLISLIREPLLGQPPPMESIAVGVGMAIGGWLFTGAVFHRYRTQLIYWS